MVKVGKNIFTQFFLIEKSILHHFLFQILSPAHKPDIWLVAIRTSAT